jgi:hypothetical protein
MSRADIGGYAKRGKLSNRVGFATFDLFHKVRSEVKFTASGTNWYPRVFDLHRAGPVSF